jgi:hypothetical protein
MLAIPFRKNPKIAISRVLQGKPTPLGIENEKSGR